MDGSSEVGLIPRPRHLATLDALLAEFPVVGLTGARQVGKTTLARQLTAAGRAHWFDLEDPRDAASLGDPGLVLPHLTGLVVLDEVQRAPDLFPLLRVLADRRPLPARFLVLGRGIIYKSAESWSLPLTLHHVILPPLLDDGIHRPYQGPHRLFEGYGHSEILP